MKRTFLLLVMLPFLCMSQQLYTGLSVDPSASWKEGSLNNQYRLILIFQNSNWEARFVHEAFNPESFETPYSEWIAGTGYNLNFIKKVAVIPHANVTWLKRPGNFEGIGFVSGAEIRFKPSKNKDWLFISFNSELKYRPDNGVWIQSNYVGLLFRFK